MSFTKTAQSIFEQSVVDYHRSDHIDTKISNPYIEKSLEYHLYQKNWIDTVQWHLEDLIRKPDIDPIEALVIKRKIDRLNQERTDMVELIDDFFLDKYKSVNPFPHATFNTESPAWAIDRLSILVLKIYHMRAETKRPGIDKTHQQLCQQKLNILLVQCNDLVIAIDHLLSDIEKGNKYMKSYKQMKMYNDPSLNPVLYRKK